ncbi:pyruvate kinase [Rhizobium leguminosarum]|uniref:pyruvate kinase n=1 Tax=Rhizobium leguminosarum TaxID=384 RepID=UPI00143F0F1F|nr:pyruvate kinase [Rhizobium leguminosarum]NKL20819.1 hypothetical protein [Rhizobium leguminosarum bv. viciae]NKL57877.1 hypothetical protein [Rhizobium leguminosarum bv. viciae]
MHRNRRAKIVATVGPASASPEMLKSMFEAGVDTFRLNFSHGAVSIHSKEIVTYEDTVDYARQMASKSGLSSPQDNIVVVAGIPFGRPGTTNNLRVVQLKEEVGRRGP